MKEIRDNETPADPPARRLTICLVGPQYPYRGGIAHYTTMLAEELARFHDVHLINYRRLYPRLLFPGTTEFDRSQHTIGESGERVIDVLWPPSWWSAAEKIRAFKPDLVIIQWWQPLFAPMFIVLSRVLRLSGIPSVLLCHNVVSHEKRALDRWLSELAFMSVSGLIVHNSKDAKRISQSHVKLPVIQADHPLYDMFPRGPETPEAIRTSLSIPDDERVILFFGLVRPYKGVTVLLRALSFLRDKPVTCLVVGEFYEPRQPYLDLVQQLGIGQKVHIIDEYVPNEEVYRYFSVADAVVLPYLTASHSGVAQIARSFTCPLIASDVGGFSDHLKTPGSGILVPPNDPARLAEAIEQIIDPQVVEAMKRTMLAEADRFSWRILREKIEHLEREIKRDLSGGR